MKQFLVTGRIIDPSKITDTLMQEHKQYTSLWMADGHIMLSSLKADYSGVANIVIADNLEQVKQFYAAEPFAREGAQEYTFEEINIHFISPDLK